MIDFALAAERQDHMSPRDAIYEACLLRFRPILMTTMAALLGALPLALGHGTGGELRRPLGITIIGGLIVSQLLTLYTTPVVYLYLDPGAALASAAARSAAPPSATRRVPRAPWPAPSASAFNLAKARSRGMYFMPQSGAGTSRSGEMCSSAARGCARRRFPVSRAADRPG